MHCGFNLMANQSLTQLFEHYHGELIRSLSMNNSEFIAMLCKHELLSEENLKIIQSHTSLSEKVSYFLDQVMRPHLDDKIFQKLLSAMKEYGDGEVEDFVYEFQLALLLNHYDIAQDSQSKNVM